MSLYSIATNTFFLILYICDIQIPFWFLSYITITLCYVHGQIHLKYVYVLNVEIKVWKTNIPIYLCQYIIQWVLISKQEDIDFAVIHVYLINFSISNWKQGHLIIQYYSV